MKDLRKDTPQTSPAAVKYARLRPASLITEFLRLEAASGLLLMVVAALALVLANSPAAGLYQAVLRFELGLPAARLPVLLWVNDGLMAIFFLLVGLEIKRELLVGELATVRSAALPGIAAVGGMVMPALLYVGINWGDPASLRGWAIPAATDIAFALGILALLGPRVPASLKVFLTALAILDDLGAILIIALFYTAQVSGFALAVAAAGLAALILCNRAGVRSLVPYGVLGIVVWGAVLASGVHATLAGVAVAFTIPLRNGRRERPVAEDSPLQRLEHALHPWVAFGVLPVFGLANAGLSFAGLAPSALLEPVPLGIAVGLFVGKQAGIMAACWLAVKCRWAIWPEGASAMQIYGVALLCGIGFTMSLFIGSLAFATDALQNAVKLGVFSGSLAAALAGYLILRFAPRAGA